MTDFMELALRRQSCRSFDPSRPAEPEKLRACVEAARISPSACNAQPWKYIVVQGERAADVRRGVQLLGRNKFTDSCPAFALVVEEHASLKAHVAARFASQKFAQMDIGLSVAHYCLEAEAQGLATCILGWMDANALKRAFSVPSEKRLRLVIATGYAAAGYAQRDKVRRPLEAMSEFIG